MFPFNILAILIRKISKTNYSHYALSIPVANSAVAFLDSTGSGVRWRVDSDFLSDYEIKKTFQCSREINATDFVNWFNGHEGKSYGFGQLIGIMLKIFGFFKHNPFGNGAKRIICNELVVLFLNEFYDSKIEDIDGLDLNDTELLIKELI